MSNHNYEVYLPVAITIDKHGNVKGLPQIDFEGAPWAYVDKQENIWTDDPVIIGFEESEELEYAWGRGEGIEEAAMEALNLMLVLAWEAVAEVQEEEG